MPPSNFKSPFVFIASTFEERGALAVLHHHSNWTWASLGCTRKPPNSSLARSPRDPCFASLLNLHFFLRFSVRRVQPLKTSGRFTARLYARLHFQSNTHREKARGFFLPPIFFFLWIMLPSLHEQGNWGHFELLIFLSRTYGDRHVSSGHAERARSCQQISLFIFPFCIFLRRSRFKLGDELYISVCAPWW